MSGFCWCNLYLESIRQISFERRIYIWFLNVLYFSLFDWVCVGPTNCCLQVFWVSQCGSDKLLSPSVLSESVWVGQIVVSQCSNRAHTNSFKTSFYHHTLKLWPKNSSSPHICLQLPADLTVGFINHNRRGIGGKARSTSDKDWGEGDL
jgi:hypothetical protein